MKGTRRSARNGPRAKEARARRREAFLRAADADDDGASLDAIEQEIETLGERLG